MNRKVIKHKMVYYGKAQLETYKLKTKLNSCAAGIAIAFTIGAINLSQVAWTQPQESDPYREPTGEAVQNVKNISTPLGFNSNVAIIQGKRPKIALVLGGGGTRGAAHVGVLRVLTKTGIPIDMIVGTSMGAIIGGLFSASISVENLEKKFEDGSLMKSFMNVPLTVSIATAPVLVLPRTLAHKQYDGLYKGNKFREYLDHTVPEYERNIENLRIPFAAV
ncbi:MAG: patatin-like phospholipase family protein, partial [Candidatus Obscuribacterales bacterium]|nr:patatin-like phospholipase family protein [Candidatus Obscuribacterales bacterium]